MADKPPDSSQFKSQGYDTPSSSIPLPPRPGPPTPNIAAGLAPSFMSAKPTRVLACVLCQQRKIKCDRRFPCANCTKHKTTCIPATQTRRRRKRFPERELLDTIKRYEDLMKKAGVKFTPLHGDDTSKDKATPESWDMSDDDPAAGEEAADDQEDANGTNNAFEVRSLWHAIGTGVRPPPPSPHSRASSDTEKDPGEEETEGTTFANTIQRTVRQTWQEISDDGTLLFGSRHSRVELATLHPEPVTILRLWQTYLDNVNPLLKITHTPTLQGRIIAAAGDVKNVGTNFEALLFGIYAVAVVSMTAEECETAFGQQQDDLIRMYQFGSQQALMNAGFLRTSDLDCMTGLFLYLTSIRSGTDPQTLCTLSGIMCRVAKRVAIHNEATLSHLSPFDAEIRRRLWWAFVLSDSRRCEIAEYKSVELAPTWDCAIPANVSDVDLRPEMKERPTPSIHSTEALFAVVRSEMADFQRHLTSYLDFTNPALKPIAKPLPSGGSLVAFGEYIEDKYLKQCDTENPLHLMTMLMARSFLSRARLVEFWALSIRPKSPRPTEDMRDAALEHSFNVLECDRMLLSSPLTQRFSWYVKNLFPFPWFVHIVQDIRRRPLGKFVDKAWQIMYDNYLVRFIPSSPIFNPIQGMFFNLLLSSWKAVQVAHGENAANLQTPKILEAIREKMPVKPQAEGYHNVDMTMDTSEMNLNEVDGYIYGLGFGMAGQSPIFPFDGRGLSPGADSRGSSSGDAGLSDISGGMQGMPSAAFGPLSGPSVGMPEAPGDLGEPFDASPLWGIPPPINNIMHPMHSMWRGAS